MATRPWVLALPLAAGISLLAGCSGGSTANVQNPPPPPSSKVTIAFQPAPPASIALNARTPLTAVVSNDSSSAGVDWSLSCSIAGADPKRCGTLSALHTASAAATTYTPPSILSGNSAAVNIVAFATADHGQNVSAPVTITGFGSTLAGTYVLQAQGIDVNSFGPYQFAAAIVFDGNGGITSGEQTVNLFDLNLGSLALKSDNVTGGSYFVGADGRGTITINTADQNVGVSGAETFSFVALSNSHALIAETDISETARGTMDLQTSAAAPTGGYAFVVNGVDTATATPTAMGGVFNIDSANTISGTGSIIDQNLAGTLTLQAGLSGTVSPPDALGAVTINLNVPTFPTATTFQFTGYIVDATHIKIIESDNVGGGGSGSTAGVAIGQGSATGTFWGDGVFSGTYVYGVTGVDLAATAPSSYTSAGWLTADGSGGVSTGFTDTFLQANGVRGTSGSQIRAAFNGTYLVNKKGIGRVRVALGQFAPQQIPAISPVFFFYLTGNGNPPLVLDAGDFSAALNYPSLGTGIAYLRSSAPLTFGGDYGFSLTQVNATGESDATGQMTANSATGTLSETADINLNFNFTSGNEFTDTFTAPIPAGGVSPGTILASLAAVNYYVIDAGHGFMIETDLPTSGSVGLGTYAARTPVCAGCP